MSQGKHDFKKEIERLGSMKMIGDAKSKEMLVLSIANDIAIICQDMLQQHLIDDMKVWDDLLFRQFAWFVKITEKNLNAFIKKQTAYPSHLTDKYEYRIVAKKILEEMDSVQLLLRKNHNIIIDGIEFAIGECRRNINLLTMKW